MTTVLTPESTDRPEVGNRCVCGASIGDRGACSRCGRLAVETRLAGDTAVSHERRTPRAPARRPLLPLLAFVCVLGGIIYHFNRERPLPWEEMPAVRSKPTGASAVWRLDLSSTRFRTTLSGRLTKLERTWLDGRVEKLQPLSATMDVLFDGRRRRLSVLDFELARDLRGGGTVRIGLPIPRRLSFAAAALTGAQHFIDQPMRQGDADAISIDSRRFPAMRRFRDIDLRGWAGYAVRRLSRDWFRIDLRGGGAIEGDPIPAAARRYVSFLIPRRDGIERVRFKWRGELRANHRRGMPLRLVSDSTFELVGVRKQERYTLTGELVLAFDNWVYVRRR